MGILDEIRSLLGSDERTYPYRCLDCDVTFDSPEPVMADVTCPDCRSTRITSGTPKPA